MFCPKCGVENAESAQFCRACGANISLVPQAVSGQLAERIAADEVDAGSGHRKRRRHGDDVSIERAVRSLFMGVAFIFVAFSVRAWAPGGNVWWFWMFLPAAGLLADGVSTYVRLRERRAKAGLPPYAPGSPALVPPAQTGRLPERTPGDPAQPPSVTEGTTRHLATPPARGREKV